MTLFAPYRTIGIFCDGLPISFQKFGNSFVITSSIGNTYHVYNLDRINLISVGPVIKNKIELIDSLDENVVLFSNSRLIHCYRNFIKAQKKVEEKVIQINITKSENLPGNGSKLLLLGIIESGLLNVWSLDKNMDLLKTIKLSSTPVCMALLPFYHNKLLVGRKGGEFDLINFCKEKIVYTFKSADKIGKMEGGNKDENRKIVLIQPAFVKNIVAVGYKGGEIRIIDIKQDKEIYRFRESNGNVTAIAFSRCEEVDIMASATDLGYISLWSLENRSLIKLIVNAHNATISSLYFVPDKLDLISSSHDNSIKIWKIDPSKNSARVIKSRCGHSLPPTIARFYDEKGHNILSAGPDKSLRSISTIKDEQSKEISQGKLSKAAQENRCNINNLKLPPATQLAALPQKEREWCNVLTCHQKTTCGVMWSFEDKVIGKKRLKLRDADEKSVISSVALSSCGNFGILGTHSGRVLKYNMQSGIFCGEYLDKNDYAHNSTVNGLKVDAFNKLLISGSKDHFIKFWDLSKRNLVASLTLKAPVTSLSLHKDSSLLATASEDKKARIIDVKTFRVIREFCVLTGTIIDMAFHPGAFWLIIALSDQTIRVFDIMSSKLIDWIKFENTVTSVDFSPDRKFLLTTHEKSLGLHLWINKEHFTNIFPKTVDETKTPEILMGPEISSDKESSEDLREMGKNVFPFDKKGVGLDVCKNGLVTFAGASDFKWKNIAFIDLIKERNKPSETIKRQNAPFFLPTTAGIHPTFVGITDDNVDQNPPEISKKPLCFIQNNLVEKIDECNNQKYEKVIKFIQSQSPTKIDLFFRVLENKADIIKVCRFFEVVLKDKSHFELIQSCLHLFLKYHSGNLVDMCDNTILGDLLKSQERSSEQFEEDVEETLCFLSDTINPLS